MTRRAISWDQMLPLAPNGAGPVNCFALVTYIPYPLGAFLDSLRRELEPGCPPCRAHVTLLPPRPLQAEAGLAWTRIRERSQGFSSFAIEAHEVTLFEATSVIYVSVGEGSPDLRSAHERFNVEELGQREAFPYCPHITLAQTLKPEQIPAAMELAQRRWLGYQGPRRFLARRFTFVQNTENNCWRDLGEFTGEPTRTG